MPEVAAWSAVPLQQHNLSWVEHYLETPWVFIFAGLAPSFPAHEPGQSGEGWGHFFALCSLGSLILALLGVAVTAVVFCRCGGRCCYATPSMPERKPSPNIVFYKVLLLLFVSTVGVLAYLGTGQAGIDKVELRLRDLTDDMDLVAREGMQLATTSEQVADITSNMLSDCNLEAQSALSFVLKDLFWFANAVNAFNNKMMWVHKLDLLYDKLDDFSESFLYRLSVPLVLVFVSCAFLVLSLCTFGCGGHCCGRFGGWLVRRVGVMLFVPVILATTVASSVEMGFALALGSFCSNADTNALTSVHRYFGENTYNISSYYIKGAGSNVLIDTLRKANMTAQQMSSRLDGQAKTFQAHCSMSLLGVDNITTVLHSSDAAFTKIHQLLDPIHIYPYYQHIVHGEACGSVIGGVGWLISLQYLAGIVCVPILASLVDRFFKEEELFSSRPAAPAGVNKERTPVEVVAPTLSTSREPASHPSVEVLLPADVDAERARPDEQSTVVDDTVSNFSPVSHLSVEVLVPADVDAERARPDEQSKVVDDTVSNSSPVSHLSVEALVPADVDAERARPEDGRPVEQSTVADDILSNSSPVSHLSVEVLLPADVDAEHARPEDGRPVEQSTVADDIVSSSSGHGLWGVV